MERDRALQAITAFATLPGMKSVSFCTTL